MADVFLLTAVFAASGLDTSHAGSHHFWKMKPQKVVASRRGRGRDGKAEGSGVRDKNYMDCNDTISSLKHRSQPRTSYLRQAASLRVCKIYWSLNSACLAVTQFFSMVNITTYWP